MPHSNHAQHGNDRQRVLEATDIVRLVGEEVSLKPKGREYLGLCPFHDDNNPSMYVVPHKQIFHCFVCGAGGNAIDYTMRRHGLDFRETLQLLADKAGIELTPYNHKSGKAQGQTKDGIGKKEIAQANAFAQHFFTLILRHPDHGTQARETLAKRGMTQAMIETFGVGAAPDRWDGLVETARAKNIPRQWLNAAGLCKERADGSAYDAFRNRITFPIYDLAGRVAAFGGRRLRDTEQEGPKYLNSPESALFDKSSTLFGLPQAQRAVREANRAIVVEGYTDVIACHQAGVRNVVAALGTAFTEKHAAILARSAAEIVMLFDGDEAGMRAADRAVETTFSVPTDVRIARLQAGMDPDETLKRTNGPDAFAKIIDGAHDALAHRMQRLHARLQSAGPAARARAVQEDAERLAAMGIDNLPPIRKRQIVSKLASLAGVDAAAVLDAMAGARRPKTTAEHQTQTIRPTVELSNTQRAAWGALLIDPALADELGDDARDALGKHPVANAFWTATQQQHCDLNAVIATIEHPDDRAAAASMAAETLRITENDPQRVQAHLRGAVATLRRERALPQTNNKGVAESLDALRKIRTTLGDNPLAVPRPATQPKPGTNT